MSSPIESISTSDISEYYERDRDGELYSAIFKLPTDILLSIFKIIASDTSKKELASLCLVCKPWKDIAQPLLFSYPMITNIKKMVQFFRCLSKYHYLRSHVKGLFLDETGNMNALGELENHPSLGKALERFWPYFDHYIGLLNSDFNLKTLGISCSLVGRVYANFYCKKLDLDTLILTHPNGLSSTKITNLSARSVIIYGCNHVWNRNTVNWYNIANIPKMQNLTIKVGSLDCWDHFVVDIAKVLNHRHNKANKPPLSNINIQMAPFFFSGAKQESFTLLENNGLLLGAELINVVKWETFKDVCNHGHSDWENFDWLNPTNHAFANNKDCSFSLNQSHSLDTSDAASDYEFSPHIYNCKCLLTRNIELDSEMGSDDSVMDSSTAAQAWEYECDAQLEREVPGNLLSFCNHDEFTKNTIHVLQENAIPGRS